MVRVSVVLRHQPGFAFASNATIVAAFSPMFAARVAAALCLPQPNAAQPVVTVLNVSAMPGTDARGFARTHVLLRLLLDRGTLATPHGSVVVDLPRTSDMTVLAQFKVPLGAAPSTKAEGPFGVAIDTTARAVASSVGRGLELGCKATAAWPSSLPLPPGGMLAAL
jgi:hypothetical protein